MARLVVLAAAAFLITMGGARADEGVSCGATITVDTTLTNDLKCSGDGLFVSADEVTLDLNGHTVRGSGTGSGVTITGAGVTLKNGSAKGFEDGIRVAFPGDHATLTGVTANVNGTGLMVFAANDATVTHSNFSNNATVGIWERALGLTIEDSKISHNGGDGFYAFPFSGGLKLISNELNDNGGSGIHFEDSDDGSTVSGNTASRNGGDGIQVYSSTGSYTGNTTRQNQRNGIWIIEGAGLLFAQHELIADNTSNGNGAHGILSCTQISSPQDLCAPGMVDGGGNLAKHNDLTPQCVNIVCRLSLGKA